jgi:hypothetical protein
MSRVPPAAAASPCSLFLPKTYAALCRAVAAADLLNTFARASANFFAQSGRTRSVVTTFEEVAEREVALLRVWFCRPVLWRDVDEDMADVAALRNEELPLLA